MNQQDYHRSISVNKSAKEAFNAIRHVSEFWTKNLDGSSENLNDVFTVHFGETFVDMKIVEYVPDQKIVWLVTDCYLGWLSDKTEWNNTKIVWEVFNINGSTTVSLTHLGLVPEVECYETCVKGWDFYLKESLYKLITENAGVPDRQV